MAGQDGQQRIAVTLEAPTGERGVLIGPASNVADLVRPEAVVDQVDDDVAECRVCGCTEDGACPGGCWWVSDPEMGDLCSRCQCTDCGRIGARDELARCRICGAEA